MRKGGLIMRVTDTSTWPTPDELIEANANGTKWSEIATVLGVSRPVVMRYIRRGPLLLKSDDGEPSRIIIEMQDKAFVASMWAAIAAGLESPDIGMSIDLRPLPPTRFPMPPRNSYCGSSSAACVEFAGDTDSLFG